MLRSFTIAVAASAALTSLPSAAEAATGTSYAALIRQYVEQDKTYLLQSIRQKAVAGSEKTVIEALLAEDGPKAVALFQKQLAMYPDPSIDPISQSRIADYNRTLTAEVPAPQLTKPVAAPTPPPPPAAPPKAAPAAVPPPAAPQTAKAPVPPPAPVQAPAPQPEKPARFSTTAYAEGDTHTLQFGSFSSRANAEALAERVKGESPVTVVFENQMYKVRLASGFPSADAAKSAGKRLSIRSVTIPIR